MSSLIMTLRQDFGLYVRPHFEKSECEICGSCTERLHVHHMKNFQYLLDETLEQLDLQQYDDTDMYSDEELQLIRNIMLGKQIKIDYVTCCEPCHKELHNGSYKPTSKRHLELKLKADEELRLKAIEVDEYFTQLYSECKPYHSRQGEFVGVIVAHNKEDKLIIANKIDSRTDRKILSTTPKTMNETLERYGLSDKWEVESRTVRHEDTTTGRVLLLKQKVG